MNVFSSTSPIVLCRDPSVHPSLGRVNTNMDGQKYGWTGKKMKPWEKGLPKPYIYRGGGYFSNTSEQAPHLNLKKCIDSDLFTLARERERANFG